MRAHEQTDRPRPAGHRPGGLARWAGTMRTPLGASAAALVAVVILLAVMAPVLWSARASALDTGALSQGPSARHWLGTDDLGRDLFYRVLVATRLSVELALLATVIGVGAGVLLGVAPWLLGRRTGRTITAAINIAVAFPALLLALFFAVVFGVGAKGAVLAIGFATVPWYARLTQTLVARVQGRDFIAAAQIVGAGRMRILYRHLLGNIGEPLIINATIGAGNALLSFAGLSFLGLGVQPPAYDWGQLLNQGLSGIYEHPLGALAPGVAITTAGLAFNLFGEAVAKHIGFSPTALAGTSWTRSRPARTAPPTSTSYTQPEHHQDGSAAPVLAVEDLQVTFPGPDGPVALVRQVSFTIGRGEAVGVVGESGSGKSLTAMAVARLTETPLRVAAERLEFLGVSLLGTDTPGMTRHLLGTSFGMVFQDPSTSFNPVIRIGWQLAEVAREHQGVSRGQALARAVDRLQATRVPAAAQRAGQYPHEFSGGMRQRAMIAMAIMGAPALIVADEPTTALDVTVQRQVLRLLQDIRRADEVAILLISHDITVVAQHCDRVLVMYAGRIVEDLPSTELRTRARHPYTRALLAAVPDMTADRSRPLPVIPGRPADPARLPAGCAFAPRCPLASDRCHHEDPPLTGENGSRVACWHPDSSPLTSVDLGGPSKIANTETVHQ